MIGDGKNDVEAGQNAGCRTALIGEVNCGQDMIVNSLLEFVEKVI
jgi:D-glycero-D-manno-heptose 1,7-bisphosphate phosphatase